MEGAERGMINLKPKLYKSLVIFHFLIHIQPIQLEHTVAILSRIPLTDFSTFQSTIHHGWLQKHQHYNKIQVTALQSKGETRSAYTLLVKKQNLTIRHILNFGSGHVLALAHIHQAVQNFLNYKKERKICKAIPEPGRGGL
jgi:hypothetical protein